MHTWKNIIIDIHVNQKVIFKEYVTDNGEEVNENQGQDSC